MINAPGGKMETSDYLRIIIFFLLIALYNVWRRQRYENMTQAEREEADKEAREIREEGW